MNDPSIPLAARRLAWQVPLATLAAGLQVGAGMYFSDGGSAPLRTLVLVLAAWAILASFAAGHLRLGAYRRALVVVGAASALLIAMALVGWPDQHGNFLLRGLLFAAALLILLALTARDVARTASLRGPGRAWAAIPGPAWAACALIPLAASLVYVHLLALAPASGLVAIFRAAPTRLPGVATPAGGRVVAVAAAEAGGVWVLTQDPPQLARHTSAGQVRERVAVGRRPSDLAIDAGGAAWVSDAETGNVYKVSPDGRAIATVRLGTAIVRLAVGPRGGVLAAGDDAQLYRIAPDGRTLGRFALPFVPELIGVAPDGQVWLVAADGSLERRDAAGKLLAAGAVARADGTREIPTALAFGPRGEAWVLAGRAALALGPDGRATASVPLTRHNGYESRGDGLEDGLAVDGSGAVVVASALVQRYAPTGEVLGIFEGGADPRALAIARDGAIWVAAQPDGLMHELRAGVPPLAWPAPAAPVAAVAAPPAVRLPRPYVVTLAGGEEGMRDGPVAFASFKFPQGLCSDGRGGLYVAETDNYAIRQVSAAGEVSRVAGGQGSDWVDGPGAVAQFRNPVALAADGRGRLYVADRLAHALRRVDLRDPARTVTTVAGKGDPTEGRPLPGSLFEFPTGVMVEASGDVLLVDSQHGRICRVSPAGAVSVVARGLQTPYAVAAGPRGSLYATEQDRIVRLDRDGRKTLLAGAESGFADGRGTAARFNYPTSLAVDARGDIWVADTFNARIRRVSPDGVVRTVAGGAKGFADGAAGQARFATPYGLSFGRDGVLYIADGGNHRIRALYP